MTKREADDRITRRDLLRRLTAAGLSLLCTPALAHGSAHGATPRPAPHAAPRDPWNESFEVGVTFQIGDPRNRLARRPYVAVYIEDPGGAPVRTLSLWKERSGNTWLRHLRRWYRANMGSRSSGEPSLVSSVSSATRPPGRYTVLWDGRDDAGKLVEQGTYVVSIESIRQGGMNHLIQKEFTFGAEPFEVEVEPEADIQGIVIEYRKRR